MPRHYTYLISSLPMLHFKARPPFSFEEFLAKCAELTTEDDVKAIRTLVSGEAHSQNWPIIKRWVDFDTMLRNELVKARAVRKRRDPVRYLRPDGYAGASFYHLAVAAVKNPSVLEAEISLDRYRWEFLDELSFGHYFDLDFLIIYACKLLILERWERINTADKNRLFKDVLAKN